MTEPERTYDDDQDEELLGHNLTMRCPHCDGDLRLEAEDLPWDDEATEELQCYHCDGWFQVRASATVEHYVSKPDEPEEEEAPE